MEFELKKKKYDWKDFLILPCKCDALSTVALSIQKISTALAAVFQVAILAHFIDASKMALENKSGWKIATIWFILLSICVGWRRISFVVGKIFISRLRVNAISKMGIAFTDKLSCLHFSQIENENSWNLIKRVCTNPENQVRLMLQRTLNLILYLIRIFGVLYIVFVNVWWIGILTALMCIPLIFISLKSGKENYNSKKFAAEYERRYQYLGEVLSGRSFVNERNLFGFSEGINEEWKMQYEDARKIKLNANRMMVRSIRGGSAVVTLLSSFIAIVLLFPTAKGTISVGMCVALVTGMYDLVNMVGLELVKAVSQLSQCREYLRDMSEFLNLREIEGADSLPKKKAISFETLEFKNVTFCYPGMTLPILKNCSFKIEKGKHYAFVGVNGAGKTTITKLMTLLYDNYEGEILINGKELRSFLPEDIRALFCGVYQSFAKYHISIEDNVMLGAISTDNTINMEEKVKLALKQVDLWNYVQGLPMGLQTPLGKILDGGVDLSGGQWQKLAMARAIISNAPILILDEPTAAMDPISECRLYEDFTEICEGKTSIFVSHRLGSTKLADKIFVLEKGRVIEEGSYQDLLKLEGAYANMYNTQKSWYKQ